MADDKTPKSSYDVGRAIVKSHSSIRVIEEAVGRVDSSNTTFSATREFYANSLMVYIDGVRKFEKEHYQVTSTKEVQFKVAPTSGKVYFDYVPPDQLVDV